MPEYQKIALVTGAASGIGFATAKMLLEQGVRVLAVARNESRCKHALEHMDHKENIEFFPCDLSSRQEILSLAEKLRSRYPCIDALIHCAGMQQSHYMTNDDGLEMQFAVNHLATFILTYELLPCLKPSNDARVILLSSIAHKNTRLDFSDLQLQKGYTGYRQYKRTKLMNTLFAVELNRRLKGLHIRAFAVDPGFVNTEFGSKGLMGLEGFFCRLVLKHGVPPEVPARCIAYTALNQRLIHSDAVYWKDCKPQKPDPYIYNEDAAKKLFDASERFGRTGDWKID